MKSKNKAILWGILTLAWTGVIFSFSLQPASQSSNLSGGLLTKLLAWIAQWTGIVIPMETVHNLFRKLAHFTEFFLLGICSGQFFRSLKQRLLWALIYGGGIAFLDESLQFLTGEGRAMRFSDMVLDTFGVFVALLFVWIFSKFFARKHENQKEP